MEYIVKLYSNKKNVINRFLNSFYKSSNNMKFSEKETKLEWQKKYQNPLDIVDMIGTFIENNDNYKINMWVSLDKNVFINVNEQNADKLIRYIYERYPW